ncbi:MAG TPA: helix-turn-helix domain-containing protein [Clostridia bacterium]
MGDVLHYQASGTFAEALLKSITGDTHLIEFYSNIRENGIRNDGLYFIKPELSKIMKAKKLTKKALAEKANISVRTLQGIFSRKRIKPRTVHAISKALEEKVDTLFEPVTEVEMLADRTILHHHRLMSCILRTAVE